MNQQKLPENLLEGWTVLVVDDHAVSLEIVTDLLSHYGATVLTATNGIEGLEITGRVHPMFIITDISMPEMDGWTFAEKLQEDKATDKIPVIALTAHAMQGDRHRAMEKGMYNYLTKPLNPYTFVTQIVVLLEDAPVVGEQLTRRIADAQGG
jgi:two-component system cell cycle response regulator